MPAVAVMSSTSGTVDDGSCPLRSAEVRSEVSGCAGAFVLRLLALLVGAFVLRLLALLALIERRGAEESQVHSCSDYLLYWYKSTARSVAAQASQATKFVLNLLVLLVQKYKY
jgi:predicted tellurium resistance membrane protein TerC